MPLILIATPIGNMGDITLRAIETLNEADIVASEDTRRTGLLLKRLEIKKKQLSFFEHNERAAGRRILDLLAAGQSVALVTSAGTPGISDPGYTIVRDAIDAGHAVTMIPGPSAPVMAVVLSGLPVHSFTFKGFPPRKKGRKTFFAQEAESPHTLVFFEAAHRLAKVLGELVDALGDRSAAVCLELTKKFERVERGSLKELRTRFEAEPPRGEAVIVVEGAVRKSREIRKLADETEGRP